MSLGDVLGEGEGAFQAWMDGAFRRAKRKK
jgi:hypothetical protein